TTNHCGVLLRHSLTTSKVLLDPPLHHSVRCPIHMFDELSGISFQAEHDVPHWVEPNSVFHIRIRLDRDKQQTPLTDALLATTLLESAEFYDSKFRWHIALFFLMPDHVHALLAFQRDESMSRIIGDWKHFHARKNRVEWQEG